MRPVVIFRVFTLTLLATLSVAGCNRDGGSGGGTAPQGQASGSTSGPDNMMASGPGSVAVHGKELVYQNLHVQVPWDASDPVKLIGISQEAAAGKGLKLSNGQTTLQIASDGRSVQLNGKNYGALQPGDHIVLTADGKLTVNGTERTAQEATTQA